MKKFLSRNRRLLTIPFSPTGIAIPAGLLFLLLLFSGPTTPVCSAEPFMPAFGTGPVEVRLYTDYFCVPCRNEEKEVIALITAHVEKNRIRVLFIDTPVHRETVFYACSFLKALNAENSFRRAVAVRGALFEAAENKITGREALEAFLMTKKVDIRPFDTAPVLKIFGSYLKEDGINSTPTCVIIGPQGKQTLKGKDEITRGLRDLKK